MYQAITSDMTFVLVMIKVNIFNDVTIKYLTLISDRFCESIGLLLWQLHRLPHKLWDERNDKWNCE